MLPLECVANVSEGRRPEVVARLAAAARAIARRVRKSGGGLPAVRAMGVYLASRGLAQVSMNLVDYPGCLRRR